MAKRIAAILFLLILVIPMGKAQFSFKIQSGISYIEHFSTGITFGLGKNNLSFIYGSDFFINRNDFSTCMFQYDRYFKRFKFKGFTPIAGVKGGYSVYTNKYYKWTLMEIVPFLGIGYPVGKRTDLALNMGITVSEEHSLERIRYGEIGTYRKYLPEFKLTLLYKLCGR